VIRILLLIAAGSTAAWAAVTGDDVPLAGLGVSGLGVSGTVVFALVLLLFSGFFSGSETALFSLQPIDRRTFTKGGPVDQLLREPRQTLASLLIGNEFINVLLSSVTAGLIAQFFPGRAWLNVLIVTPMLLLFGEVVPKTLALRLNRRIAPMVAPLLRLFSRFVTPLRWLITRVADAALVLTGGTLAPRQAALREAQLRNLVEQGRRAGAVGPMEEEMIQKVFEFGDLTVSRLMTPRPDIFSLKLHSPWGEIIDQLRTSSRSRVPIWEGRPDNIIGILILKDLLPHLASRFREVHGKTGDPRELALTTRQLQKILLPAHFVPTSKRAEDMLAEFREHRFHLAIVVDEHGNVVGLVTLDDLLAELVGELLDESDHLTHDVTEGVDGVYTVRGHMDVDDFAERFDVTLPDGEYDTVAGFILDRLGAVPDRGAEVSFQGVRFTVKELEGQRITSVCVRLPSLTPVDALHEGGQP